MHRHMRLAKQTLQLLGGARIPFFHFCCCGGGFGTAMMRVIRSKTI
jgi:hypothetical protein